MKIDGNKIAQKILKNLQKKTEELKKQGIIPKLAIILINDDSSSKSYVKQKEIKAKEIGVETTTIILPISISKKKLKEKVDNLNKDKSIHGIIIQRPLPPQIDSDFATSIIAKEKDIDGLREDSNFQSPIAQAVAEVLKEINLNLKEFLKTKKITVIGKGETGGGPIINFLEEQGIKPAVIDRNTKDISKLIRESDVIISTVGKPNIINTKDLKKDVVLIGIGIYKDNQGKFQADYNQEEADKIASFYTPVPGGIGPLTVTFLLKNLVIAIDNKRFKK